MVGGRFSSRRTIELAVVAALYFGAAKFGLKLSVAHGVITPVWPPAGIAIAALLLRGPGLWPAIAVAAFAGNATTGASIAVALAIAVGNTAEALVGWYLLDRAHFRPTFERSRDVISFTVLAGFVSTAVAATNGVTVLRIAGSDAADHYGFAWTLWWLGDAMGVLLVAPVLLVWGAGRLRLPPRARIAEGLLLTAALVGVGAGVFLGGLWRYPYAVFPLLVIATMRFHQRGAATGSFIVAAMGIAGVIGEQTPLGESPTNAVQIMQGLLAFIAVSLLVLGATLDERDRATARLAEAQELAHVGSWEWDVVADQVTWSDELYRIYGVAPGTRIDLATFLEHVHPDDRERTRRVVDDAARDQRSFEVTHRIVLDDGVEKSVVGRGQVVVDGAGRLLRMAGTAQDVTEQRAADALRETILSTVSHELRTPLTAILGFALTLRERGAELSDGLRRDLTDNLVQQAARLERLLTDLLDVDRLRHGLVRAVREPTDVSVLVTRVVEATGHSIAVDAQPVVARVDPPKLERIVENLLVNAIKHTPSGTEISAAVNAEGRDLLIRVDDRGKGIADADKQDVFTLFARPGANGAPGTGVGLALVAQFTALHGGSVWVEDRDGGGASFRVRLPDCVLDPVHE